MAKATEPATLTPTTKLSLPETVLEKIPLLIPHVAKPLLESLGAEMVPSTPEAKSPEAILAKAIGDRGPAAKVARVAELQAAISKINAVLEVSKGSGDLLTDVEESLVAKRDAMEVALAKAQKDAPSQLSELKAVMEARSSYEVTVQTRRDLQKKGADKAKDRNTWRHAHIQELRDQLNVLEAGLTTAEKDNDAAHFARAAAYVELDEKVLALFDARIAALQAPAAQRPEEGQAAASSPNTQLAIQPASGTPSPNLMEYEAMRRDLAEKAAKVEEWTNSINAQYNKRFEELTPACLPKTVVPADKSMLAAYGSLHREINQWTVAGAAQGFEWDALDTVAGPDHEASAIAKELVGSAWTKWYPDADPDRGAVVPKQLVLLLGYCLNQVAQLFEEEATKMAIDALASNSQNAVRESAKRLRCE